MKLDLLREVAGAVFEELRHEGLKTTCYYFFDEKWRSTNDPTLALTPDVVSALNKASSDEIAYHAPSSKVAWFYFEDLNATMSVEFPISPRVEKRSKVRSRIASIRTNAINAFKVSHNELTGLLSRDAFRQKLRSAISETEAMVTKGFVLASEGQLLHTVSVLAFDIDKFKQVNDTNGHIYGDQVLKIFARRLEEAAEALRVDYGPGVKIALGHPSGEEFLVLIEGPLSNEDLSQIADRFRLAIADDPLPSDNEWQQLTTSPELEKVPLPAKADRLVTTSVGIASHIPASKMDDSAPLVLLDKADIALYKSKSGGRNRITLYDDIIQHCGRVLEHDLNTGVVAIDIGTKVGVNVGQEFRVFPTTYCGTTAYTLDDGRSRKILGYYPKIELCRIVVFDSQSDISFAYIASQSSAEKTINSGASIEAVPLGTITHLIESSRGEFGLGSGFGGQQKQNIFSGAELQQRVDQAIAAKGKPVALVLRLKHERELYKKYGSAALNRALAQLFSRIREHYSAGYLTGLIDTTAICVVGDAATFSEEELEELIARNYPPNDELEPICGYYCAPPDPEDANISEEAKPNIDKHAVELARYALSETEGFKEKRIQRFSTAVAERIVSQHRNLRSYSAGVADYVKLKNIGIVSATFENNGGLCYSALGENRLALECYLRATELSPTQHIYRGNAAILALRAQEFELGVKLLLDADISKLERAVKLQPGACWAYAALLAHAHKAASPLYDPERMRIVGPMALNVEGARQKMDYELVRVAVAALPNAPQ